MIINDGDKFFITDAINRFIKSFGRTLRGKDFCDLKNVMEKIELCVDNNQPDDNIRKLPIYLASAKVVIRNIPGSPLKQSAREVINVVEALTPPITQYYPSRINNIAAQNSQWDEVCSLKCVIC